MRVKLGGVAYGGMVRVEHAAFMASMCVNLSMAHINAQFGYMQSSLLHWGRARWLTNAIEQGFDLAISVDSDTWCEPEDNFGDAIALMLMASSNDPKAKEAIIKSRPEFADIGNDIEKLALLGVAVGQRDGRINIWSGPGKRITVEEFGTVGICDVHAVGAAICIYNLRFYRSQSKALPRAFDCPIDGESEDYFHCRRVADCGGRILACLSDTYHAPTGETTIVQVKATPTADIQSVS